MKKIVNFFVQHTIIALLLITISLAGLAYAGTTKFTNVLVTTLTSTTLTNTGVATLGSAGSMATGAAVLVNHSGVYLYNKKGVRYRVYVNMTGTETSSIIAVKK